MARSWFVRSAVFTVLGVVGAACNGGGSGEGAVGHSAQALTGRSCDVVDVVVNVRHAPDIDGQGRIEGSVHQMLPEKVHLDGQGVIRRSLLVPGSPVLDVDGKAQLGGTSHGTGSASPSGRRVELGGNAILGGLVDRTDPIAFPTVAPPPAPTGKTDVHVNKPGQTVADFSSVRDIHVDGKADPLSVPPGTYRDLHVDERTTVVLGVAGAAQPSVYDLHGVHLEGQLQVVGPVVLVVGEKLEMGGDEAVAGSAAHPEWLRILASDDDEAVDLDGKSHLYAWVTAPSGKLEVDGESQLVGAVPAVDRVEVKGHGVIWPGGALVSASQSQLPPAALPGQEVDVVVRVTNGAPTTAQNVTATETFGGLLPSPASASLGCISDADGVQTATLVETAVTVPPRQGNEASADYEARLAAADGSALTASGQVSFSDAQGNVYSSVSVSSSGVLQLPRLALTLAASAEAGPGEDEPYAVTVQNAGSALAVAALVTVTFPDGSSSQLPVPALQPGDTYGTVAHWTVPAIAPRAQGESVADYLAGLATIDGSALAASASATWQDAAGNAYGAIDRTTTTVERVPIVAASASALGPLEPGEPVGVTLTVVDQGTGGASSVQLGLVSPDGASASAAPFELPAGSPPASVTLPGHAPALVGKQAGESDAAYLARLGALDGSPLTFHFTLGWQDHAGDAYGPTEGDVVTSEVVPVLNVSLAAPAMGTAGDTITYTATVTNTGAAPAPSVTLSIVLPDGSARFPAVGPLAPGAGASASVAWASNPNFAGGNVTAQATLSWQDAVGNSYGTVSSSATTNLVPSNQPPVVTAGPSQTVILPAAAALHGSVSDDGRPVGGQLTSMWSTIAGPGPVFFGNAAAAVTTASFNVPGTYVLQLSASDSALTSTAQTTITVLPPQTETLTLAPGNAGPDVTGTSQAFTATLLVNGAPDPATSVTFTVSGANATTGAALTDANGVAHFTYAGNSAGSDTVVATVQAFGNTLSSNVAAVSWLTPTADVSTTTIYGRFFASNGSGAFTTPVTATPAFSMQFPTINFNPPGGTVPGAPGNINVNTRPFTDVTTDLNGNYTGSIPVQGNGQQAGNGNLFNFNAVFEGKFTVAQAGNVTFNFYSDDGWILGIGGGATRVSGPLVAVPAGNVTPFDQYPVVASYNIPSAPAANQVTVHFPAPGTYPYEVDYSECCGGSLALTMAVSTNNGHGVPPSGSLVLSPNTVPNTGAGVPVAFTVRALDASGAALQSQQVSLIVSGANAQTLTSVTNANGVATFSYVGSNVGTDTVQAAGPLSGFGAWSNVVTVNRTVNNNKAPLVSTGGDQTITLPVSSVTLSGSVTDDGLPAGGSLTQSWSEVGGPGAVTFAHPTSAVTDAIFPAAGTYQLRLTATDSQLTTTSDVTVIVLEADQPLDQAPQVYAGPSQTVVLPSVATLSGTVSDDGLPAGGALAVQWSLVSGPAPVVFGNTAAAITTAVFSLTGNYVLRLTAGDGQLSSASDVIIVVQAATASQVNQAPVVAAGPPQTLSLPSLANLNGSMVDDGLPAGSHASAMWSMVSGPGAVTFTSATSPTTMASFSAAGSYVLRLTATDGTLSSHSDVTITVKAPPPTVSAGPAVTATIPPNSVMLAGSVTTSVPGAVTSVWTKASGPGTVTFADATQPATTATFSDAGNYVLTLTATQNGQSAASSTTVMLAPPPGPAPTVSLDSHLDGSTVTGPTDITGSVSDGFWKVQYQMGGGTSPWVTLAEGTQAVTNGKLATFDPTLLLNGTYVIRVVSSTDQGTSTSSLSVTVLGKQKVGLFTLSFKDLKLPVAGLPIEVDRNYDSRDKSAGDFGVGWHVKIADVTVTKSSALGLNWEQVQVPQFLFPQECLRPTRAERVTIAFSDGRTYQFDTSTNPQCQVLFPIQNGSLTFSPVAPTQGSLVALDAADFFVNGGIGPVTLEDPGTFDPIDPQRFQLTTADGTVYVVSQTGGVESVTDRNGNTITIGANGILSSLGGSVTFTRDGQGRITRMTDPAGKALVYAYDANGDLASVTDRDGNTTTLSYDGAHGLVKIVDPLGNTPLRNDYDASGRLLSTTDGNGHTTSFSYDPASNTETLTDPLGHSITYTYDANGNIVREVDGAGHVTARTFDANGNKLSETDALGHTTTWTFNAQNKVTSVTDALGHTTSYTYNGFGQTLTTTDALGRVTTNVYDAKGNRTSTTDAAGQVTTYGYDASGRRNLKTDPDGGTTHWSFDGSGNLTSMVDPLGNVTSYTYDVTGNRTSETRTRTTGGGPQTLTTNFTYDASGRQTAVTLPDGSTFHTTYNADGLRAAMSDQLGHSVALAYDAAGHLVQRTHPDGTKDTFTYDAAGHRTGVTDALGHTTSYTWDAAGRLLATTFPDGTTSAVSRDATGRIVSATDENGDVEQAVYDAAGRRTQVVDGLGHASSYAYDAAGNLVGSTDAIGQTTAFTYDGLNRLTRVVHADQTSETRVYDGKGDVLQKTGRDGHTTSFAYDAKGHLVSVTDALGGVTRYAYDEIGNRTSITDANGHVTRFAYDKVGNRTSRALPGGQTETFTYDASGNVASHTDFNGRTTTFTYDASGRMLTKTPDPALHQATVRFTYSSTGKRASMVDATGTTTYAYDARDRLTQKATPFGTLSYGYDAGGDVASIHSEKAGGVNVQYAWNARHRLAAVTDVNGGNALTQYAYDAAGRLTGFNYPNGVDTSLQYDPEGRITEVDATSGNAMVASYAYTRDANGLVDSVAELSGRHVSYTYDVLSRLEAEQVTGSTNGQDGTISYTLDPVGNRLARASTLGGIL